MRIVLVTHFYPSRGGGVENVAANLASLMAAEGHELIWCASDCNTSPALPDVHPAPMRTFNVVERLLGFPYPLWSPASVAALARYIRAADAVHIHDGIYAGSLVASFLARRYGKPIVVTQHIGDVPLSRWLKPCLALLNRLAVQAVMREATAVAFISPAVRRYFESLSGGRGSFHDVPNGVDHSIFRPVQGSPPQVRVELGWDRCRPLLLFVGRFVPNKGLNEVRAMAEARPDWQWCVIGQGRERPQDWGLPNVRVLSHMDQSRLVAYYRAADLLVLPSKSEGFPLVVQEAMACGLPACIPAHVAAGSVLPDDVWLELPDCSVTSADRAVATIAAWLQQSSDVRSARRAACADFAIKTWNWDNSAAAHLGWLRGRVD